MKKTLMYFALLLVSGLVFSACIPKQNQESAMEENQEINMKDDALEAPDNAMVEGEVEEGRVITMEMGAFYYSQETIEAEAGETLTITIENVDGFHDFVIDELEVASEQVNEGNSVTVTFTIPEDASGQKYEYYCSVGNHRAQGMVGTLMVK
jgi:plastocyanin